MAITVAALLHVGTTQRLIKGKTTGKRQGMDAQRQFYSHPLVRTHMTRFDGKALEIDCAYEMSRLTDVRYLRWASLFITWACLFE